MGIFKSDNDHIYSSKAQDKAQGIVIGAEPVNNPVGVRPFRIGNASASYSLPSKTKKPVLVL